VQFDLSVDSRDAGEQENGGDIYPPTLCKGGLRGGGAFFITASWVISRFSKIDLKQIYCTYSRTQKIMNGFL